MSLLSRLLLAALFTVSLGGCAILREFSPSVVMEPMTPGEYIALQRGDILTTGALSAATAQTIRVSGLDVEGCASSGDDCIRAMVATSGIGDERRLSALSELWLQQAQVLRDAPDADRDATLQAWLEAARHAYAYLFFSARTPGERAFEDRQTQVRDWYNYSVQAATTLLFEASLDMPDDAPADHIHHAGWIFRIDMSRIRMPEGVTAPRELMSAASLAFKGLRSTWRRDGFGAELVAVMDDDPVTTIPEPVPRAEDGTARRGPRPPAWSEMPSPSMTVLFRFAGTTLAEILDTREVNVSAHDPYVEDSVVLHGQQVPLAANFTAGYGLWLARSGFNRQSLRTLFGRDHGIERPHLYLMQPYDPQRRIVLMLHGLASSPEAWVNVANEIQGDAVLRSHFQVWQVYYPTNAPVVLNHAAIRRLLSDALRHFDPDGDAPASHDIVLVGHSMGGVIARLMVSRADDELWQWAETRSALDPDLDIDPVRLERARPHLEAMLGFSPFPGVERAIFIAAPHRGTAVASQRVGRWISRLVRLPLTLLEGIGDVLQGEEAPKLAESMPNSIDNLDEHDAFVLASANLPISPQIRYHSIVAQLDPGVPLADSDDGLVPYRSAHLPGAQSEKVVVSGHSVQETAQAILEIRRILHLDLDERGVPAPDHARTPP